MADPLRLLMHNYPACEMRAGFFGTGFLTFSPGVCDVFNFAFSPVKCPNNYPITIAPKPMTEHQTEDARRHPHRTHIKTKRIPRTQKYSSRTHYAARMGILSPKATPSLCIVHCALCIEAVHCFSARISRSLRSKAQARCRRRNRASRRRAGSRLCRTWHQSGPHKARCPH